MTSLTDEDLFISFLFMTLYKENSLSFKFANRVLILDFISIISLLHLFSSLKWLLISFDNFSILLNPLNIIFGAENSFLGSRCLLWILTANSCLNPCNSEVKLDIISSYLFTCESCSIVLTTFLLMIVWIFFARFEYNKVLIVSSILYIEGDIVLIMTILELPPKQSFNILVNFEFLQGINLFFVAKALIHTPKASKLLFIFFPSFCLSLFGLPLFILVFSLPAKSTIMNLPFIKFLEFLSWLHKLILKTAWDLDDVSLLLVLPVVLFLFPNSNKS